MSSSEILKTSFFTLQCLQNKLRELRVRLKCNEQSEIHIMAVCIVRFLAILLGRIDE